MTLRMSGKRKTPLIWASDARASKKRDTLILEIKLDHIKWSDSLETPLQIEHSLSFYLTTLRSGRYSSIRWEFLNTWKDLCQRSWKKLPRKWVVWSPRWKNLWFCGSRTRQQRQQNEHMLMFMLYTVNSMKLQWLFCGLCCDVSSFQCSSPGFSFSFSLPPPSPSPSPCMSSHYLYRSLMKLICMVFFLPCGGSISSKIYQFRSHMVCYQTIVLLSLRIYFAKRREEGGREEEGR